MRIGYARVSTREQNADGQLDALTAAGCERVFTDTASGKLARRPEWDRCLEQPVTESSPGMLHASATTPATARHHHHRRRRGVTRRPDRAEASARRRRPPSIPGTVRPTAV